MIYRAFGLNFDSDLELPELTPYTADTVDVTIRVETVPPTLEDITGQGPAYMLNGSQFRLSVKDVADYYVENGRHISIAPAPQVHPSSVRLFLLGSAFGALFHQRHLFPMHASSIATPKGAVLFTGMRGMGKSTTAAAFRQRGYKMLSDDISLITLDEQQRLLITPGYPQQKLWMDSLEQLEQTPNDLKRVRPELDKFAIPTVEHFADELIPPHKIYVLTNIHTDEPELIEVKGLQKMAPLANHTYRRHFVEQMNLSNLHTRIIVQIAQQVSMFIVKRPQTGFELAALIDTIEEDFTL